MCVWVSEHACGSMGINRSVFVCEGNTCARVCVKNKRGWPVTVVLLTHALQAMLFLQGLEAQWAGGTAGKRAWHQIMPIAAAAAAAHFLFGFSLLLLPLLSLLLFFSVLTLQRNKRSKHSRRFLYANVCVLFHCSTRTAWLGMTPCNHVSGRICNSVCVSSLVHRACSNMHNSKLFTPQD